MTFNHIAFIINHPVTIFLFVQVTFVFIAGSLTTWTCRSFKSVLELPFKFLLHSGTQPYGHLVITTTFLCPGEMTKHFLIRKPC